MPQIVPQIDYTAATFGHAPDRTPTGKASCFAVSRPCAGDAEVWTHLSEQGERVPYDPSFAGIYSTETAARGVARKLWRCS